MTTTNPHKGDVSFVAAEKTYTLRYSHLALIKLEQQLNKSLMSVIKEMGDPESMRIGTIVSILWAGLQKHHPGTTFDQAAEMLDDVDGGSGAVLNIINDAFGKAFNAPGTKGTDPPQKVGNGTGMPSSPITPQPGIPSISSGN